MSDPSEILKELREIKNKPALNGGFDKLVVTIENMEEKQEEMKMDLKEIKQSLYDPEKGLYAKGQKIESGMEKINNKFDATGKEIEHHYEEYELFEKEARNNFKELDKILKATQKLEKIAGENFEKIQQLIDLDVKIKRLFWLLITGIFTTFGKFIFDLLSR